MDRILGALAGADRAMVAVLAFTGMRSGELQRLRREDVDLAGGWIHIRSRPGYETKNRRSRKVPIAKRLRPTLEARPRRPGRGCSPPARAGRARPGTAPST